MTLKINTRTTDTIIIIIINIRNARKMMISLPKNVV